MVQGFLLNRVNRYRGASLVDEAKQCPLLILPHPTNPVLLRGDDTMMRAENTLDGLIFQRFPKHSLFFHPGFSMTETLLMFL